MAGSSCLTLKENHNEDGFRFASAASYFIIFLIGIPIWWKTTEVYRESLPYDRIDSLAHSQLKLPIIITLVFEDDNFYDLASQLSKDYHLGLESSRINVELSFNSRKLFDQELEIFKASTTISEVDHKLRSEAQLESTTIFVLSRFSAFIKKNIYVGNYHSAFIKASDVLISDVKTTLDLFINPGQVLQSYVRLVNRSFDQVVNKAPVKSISSTSAVDITFTLILPDHSAVDVSWDIENAVEDYLQPFLDKIKFILDVNVRSQIFYFTDLNIKAKLNENSSHYVISSDQLPHLINPIEIKLGSYVTTNPSLNFVVYVAPEYQSPLQIYNSYELPSLLNSFLVPRWGGFIIYNIDKAKNQNSIDMPNVFGVFLAQLRSLIGLAETSNFDKSMTFGNMNSNHLREWEFDLVLRMRLFENLLTAINNLNSLAQLLQEIGNIVISNHVGQLVFNATQQIVNSHRALDEGDFLNAFTFSRDALISSEAAFFDPSMLSLLYFPEDQKYAIYVPLFAPVSLPFILWVWKRFKICFKTRKSVTGSRNKKSD